MGEHKDVYQDGRYEVMGVIGRGGMSLVFKAIDTRLARIVALKVMRPDRAAQAERLKKEAKMMGPLQHPGIVMIFDAFIEAGELVLVLEYVDGMNLLEFMLYSPHFSQDLWLRMFGDLAVALDFLHGRGVVHRDIKPENILITTEGHSAKLADFGLARHPWDPRLTVDGIAGTDGYVAPEVRHDNLATHAADVWSMGKVMEKGISVLQQDAAFDLPAPMLSLVRSMLEADPALRPSPADIKSALGRVAAPGHQGAKGSWKKEEEREAAGTAPTEPYLHPEAPTEDAGEPEPTEPYLHPEAPTEDAGEEPDLVSAGSSGSTKAGIPWTYRHETAESDGHQAPEAFARNDEEQPAEFVSSEPYQRPEPSSKEDEEPDVPQAEREGSPKAGIPWTYKGRPSESAAATGATTSVDEQLDNSGSAVADAAAADAERPTAKADRGPSAGQVLAVVGASAVILAAGIWLNGPAGPLSRNHPAPETAPTAGPASTSTAAPRAASAPQGPSSKPAATTPSPDLHLAGPWTAQQLNALLLERKYKIAGAFTPSKFGLELTAVSYQPQPLDFLQTDPMLRGLADPKTGTGPAYHVAALRLTGNKGKVNLTPHVTACNELASETPPTDPKLLPGFYMIVPLTDHSSTFEGKWLSIGGTSRSYYGVVRTKCLPDSALDDATMTAGSTARINKGLVFTLPKRPDGSRDEASTKPLGYLMVSKEGHVAVLESEGGGA